MTIKRFKKSWFPKGKQRQIPTHGKHQGVKLIGTLNYETGEIFCVEEEKYDAEVFHRFLEKVIAHYPHGKIVVILDNAQIHHAKLISAVLKNASKSTTACLFTTLQPAIEFNGEATEVIERKHH